MHLGIRTTCLAAALAFTAGRTFAGCQLQTFAELQVTMSGSRPLVDGSINGVAARFFVDSGAFMSILAKQRLAPYHLKVERLPFGYRLYGFGGMVTPELTIARDFTLKGLGEHTFHRVAFLVTETAVSPDSIGLIGQNLLGVYDTEYDLGNGVIRLMKPKDCGKQALAYWHGDEGVAEMKLEDQSDEAPHVIGRALLNDTRIEVLFDTGSPRSLLTAKAAARAGVTRNSPGTSDGGVLSGFGSRYIESWIARFDKLDFGGEQIRNTRLRVARFDLGNNADMLLGVDFFLSHRIYIAASQHKIYFTYNGGHVFDLGVVQEKDQAADALQDAASYRRRGTASAERQDFRAALADLDQAVKLDPADAQNYYSRALVRWRNHRQDLAMADFDEALKIKPDDVPALSARGLLRLYGKDEAGARTDFDTALRLAPTDTDVAYRVADSYVAAGYFKEAIPQLDRWITANRKSEMLPVALNSRCWCRAVLNVELDLALADCNAALKKSSTNSAMLDSRALVWLRRGDFDKSIADYQAVLRLQPGKPASLYGLGLAELRKGLKEQGQRDIDTAIAQSPTVADEFKGYGLAP